MVKTIADPFNYNSVSKASISIMDSVPICLFFGDYLIKDMDQVKVIRSIEELLSYFERTEQKIFFIGRIYSTMLLDFNSFIPNFEIITCYDPFSGRFPFIITPQHLKTDHQCSDAYQCQLSILSNPETIAYMKSKSANPRVFYMMLD